MRHDFELRDSDQKPVERDLHYASADGVALTADYYRVQSERAAPVVIAVHGGGWKLGSSHFYQYWGPYLAARGIAVFAINYRLVEGDTHRYPAAVDDVVAAVDFVRENAVRLGADPLRIGLVGDSAGAHLATLAALAGNPRLPEKGPLEEIRAVVAVYGVYDLLAQWQHDLVARPCDQISEIFIGRSPLADRLPFILASPLTYATTRGRGPAYFVVWGTGDDVVDWKSQSEPFVTALKQAGCFVRTQILTDAPHYWMADPLEDPCGYPGQIAPNLLRFLQEHL